MKRFLAVCLAMSMAMETTAFAAEKKESIQVDWRERTQKILLDVTEPYLLWKSEGCDFYADRVEGARIFLDGAEKELQYPLYQIQGRMMIAAADLANAIEGHFVQGEGENNITLFADALQKPENMLWQNSQKKIGIGKGGYTDTYRKGLQNSDGIWYIPLREMAEGIGYTVTWKKTGDMQGFFLESPAMPQMTATAVYDREKQMISMTMDTQTEGVYFYQPEFFIQKWEDGEWKRVSQNREVCYIFAEQELSVKTGSKTEEYSLLVYGDGTGLPAGKYRICKEIVQKDTTRGAVYYLSAAFTVE